MLQIKRLRDKVYHGVAKGDFAGQLQGVLSKPILLLNFPIFQSLHKHLFEISECSNVENKEVA